MPELGSIGIAERRLSEFLASVGGSVRATKRSTHCGPDLVLKAVVRGKPITIIAEFESRLASAAVSRDFKYALTMFSGAARVAPAVRYNFTTFYYSGVLDDLIKELEIKPVPTGANVWVFEPIDEGVYYGLQERDGIPVVSNVQLYLDLINFKGRGEEQAAEIREQALGF